MRIASITMVGQFPEGIDIHVRNLKWALTENDHIYIVTKPEYIEEYSLKNDERVTYIPFTSTRKEERADGFIHFWKHLDLIIKKLKIDPEMFLFMETDIWFYAKVKPIKNRKVITSFLPKDDYHRIFLNNKPYHGRVWEGAQLIHADIVKRAIEFKIRFNGFVKFEDTFIFKRNYKKIINGEVSIPNYNGPDTMDEFGLYCAFIEKTFIIYDVKAIHFRGPETIARQFPGLSKQSHQKHIFDVMKINPYLDIFLVVCIYYIVQMWNDIDHIDLNLMDKINKENLFIFNNSSFLNKIEKERLNHITSLLRSKEKNIKLL